KEALQHPVADHAIRAAPIPRGLWNRYALAHVLRDLACLRDIWAGRCGSTYDNTCTTRRRRGAVRQHLSRRREIRRQLWDCLISSMECRMARADSANRPIAAAAAECRPS